MQEIIEALKAAGFTYTPNVMEPEFDYPLDFFVRGHDGSMILGEVEEVARGIIVRLHPFDLMKEWYIEDEDEIPFFLQSFEKTYEEFWQIVK